MLIEKTNIGLHSFIENIIKNKITDKSKILDVGAGTGAFIERISKYGGIYSAIEIDEKSFNLNGIKLYKLDLNNDFAKEIDEKFDIIIAIEIIEHIENPHHFIRQLKKILARSGIIIITTPNPENIPSRLKFLFKGNIRGFEWFMTKNSNKHEMQHISPIFSSLFLRIIEENDMLLDSYYSFPRKKFTNSNKVIIILSRIIAPFLRGYKFGENHIFILKNKLDIE